MIIHKKQLHSRQKQKKQTWKFHMKTTITFIDNLWTKRKSKHKGVKINISFSDQ